MDVGLDEYIKKNRNKKPQGKGPNRRPFQGRKDKKNPRNNIQPIGGVGKKIVDARLKIIAKTRSKIVDARERLNQRLRQTDARDRISKRNNTISNSGPMGKMRSDNLRRTIRNDLVNNLRERVQDTIRNRVTLHDTRASVAHMDMDVDEGWSSRITSLPRLEIHVPRMRERSYASAMVSDNVWKTINREQSPFMRSKENLKSRLEPARSDGYRIVVSNLQSSVTHEDIKELFEDIGVLVGSRVVRPGTAEVIYKNLDDAMAAVDTYHNRQLDGQPMKCLLVKPNNALNKNIGSKTFIVPDPATVHKALFDK